MRSPTSRSSSAGRSPTRRRRPSCSDGARRRAVLTALIHRADLLRAHLQQRDQRRRRAEREGDRRAATQRQRRPQLARDLGDEQLAVRQVAAVELRQPLERFAVARMGALDRHPVERRRDQAVGGLSVASHPTPPCPLALWATLDPHLFAQIPGPLVRHDSVHRVAQHALLPPRNQLTPVDGYYNLLIELGGDELAHKQQNAPGDLEAVRAFVNTVDLEDGAEGLSDPPSLVRWLADHELIEPGTEATKA